MLVSQTTTSIVVNNNITFDKMFHNGDHNRRDENDETSEANTNGKSGNGKSGIENYITANKNTNAEMGIYDANHQQLFVSPSTLPSSLPSEIPKLKTHLQELPLFPSA